MKESPLLRVTPAIRNKTFSYVMDEPLTIARRDAPGAEDTGYHRFRKSFLLPRVCRQMHHELSTRHYEEVQMTLRNSWFATIMPYLSYSPLNSRSSPGELCCCEGTHL